MTEKECIDRLNLCRDFVKIGSILRADVDSAFYKDPELKLNMHRMTKEIARLEELLYNQELADSAKGVY